MKVSRLGGRAMKFTLCLLVPLALVFSAGPLAAQATDAGSVPIDEVTNLIYKKERDAQIADTKLAPIRSKADLDEYLTTHPVSPFNAFSKRALERFVDSLTFSQLGLTGYRTAEIESDLTPRKAYAILSLFGVQKTISSLDFEHASDEDKELLQRSGNVINTDYKDYKCVGRATCSWSTLNICIGGNCTLVP
jgi:hypothetical protein